MYCYLNAGKQSLTLAPDSQRYRAELAAADVLIVTAGRSQAGGLGIDPVQLLADSPQAIIVTISDFGWAGPFAERAASEFTLQAWAGSPGFRGDPAGPPISIGGDLGEYMGGAFAAFGALAISRRVERGGPGEHLDLSMLEAMALMQSSEWLHSQLLQVPSVRAPSRSPPSCPSKTVTSASPWSPVSSGSTSARWWNAPNWKIFRSCASRSADGNTGT
ncbi:coA-transferase III family protein [Mycobacterium ulcerans str. Harvey]|uniref:CoA-transferase III family protein n=1 Tax=Mycobacterium ulcerans str. Harvey TaxID=1299332 RepID=A0ABN0QRQ6_MYCUL|nr:coA-transferase III family protein [Mycobacterium ulcerans str. Harvey]